MKHIMIFIFLLTAGLKVCYADDYFSNRDNALKFIFNGTWSSGDDVKNCIDATSSSKSTAVNKYEKNKLSLINLYHPNHETMKFPGFSVPAKYKVNKPGQLVVELSLPKNCNISRTFVPLSDRAIKMISFSYSKSCSAGVINGNKSIPKLQYRCNNS